MNDAFQYVLVCAVAMAGSALTLFSGFGLGTVLLPVFALFFPVDIAIALTAIVHFLNNIFKLVLLGRHADKKVVLKFGIPSLLAAFAGAWTLTLLADVPAITSYTLNNRSFEVTPMKLIIAMLLAFFALFDIIPRLSNLQFSQKYLPLGGVISGFFGGLSGHQGALRSAFLIRAGLSKESFIATGMVIACMVDVSRLAVYSGRFSGLSGNLDYKLLILATLSAFIGAFAGNKLLKKITVKAIQYIVAVMLLTFSALLAAGLV